MYRSERFLTKMYFGNDERYFYLRLDLRKWGRVSLSVQFHEPAGVTLKTGTLTRQGLQDYLLTKADGTVVTLKNLASAEIVELSIPLAEMGVGPGAQVHFQVRLSEDGIERECYPESVPIQFPLLSEEFSLQNWMV